MKKEIFLLQEEMKKEGIDGYIVPTDDYHGSEYVADHFKCREFLSGFTGSAGTLFVTLDSAYLWTDGRYFLQAEKELEGSGITLMRMGEKGVATLSEMISKLALEALGSSRGYILGFDGRVVNYDFGKNLLKTVPSLTIKADADLAGRIWEDRPAMPCERVYDFDVKYAGRSRSEKIDDVRKAIKKEGADALFISSMDDIAWLFNLRGNDIPCNPVFMSHAKISADEAVLFADEKRFAPELIKRLEDDGIKLLGYDDITTALMAVPAGSKVWMDASRSSYFLVSSLNETVGIINKPSPTQLMKAVKNPVEADHIRNCHIKDGTAVTKFICWLKKNVGKETITEISSMEKLEELRRQQDLYMGPSFSPIAGYKEHGAIIHYESTPETDVELKAEGLALFDTGGQYLDGTTDITRTVALGPITDEEKKYFTLVLKGHLALASVKFKKGCTGMAFDYLARRPLWDLGEDYNHGTGHGVGFFLNVHEPPNGFRYKKVPEREDGAVFEEGMLTSNEPGYYAPGKFGIRHENLVLCVRDSETPDGEFLKFETVTLVPFDRDGIDAKLLSDEEKQLLNEYHRRVYETIGLRLDEDEREWLKEATARI